MSTQRIIILNPPFQLLPIPLSSQAPFYAPPPPLCAPACVVRACDCASARKQVHSHGNQSRWWGIFLSVSPPYCLEAQSLTKVEAGRFGQAGRPVNFQDQPVSASPGLGLLIQVSPVSPPFIWVC